MNPLLSVIFVWASAMALILGTDPHGALYLMLGAIWFRIGEKP